MSDYEPTPPPMMLPPARVRPQPLPAAPAVNILIAGQRYRKPPRQQWTPGMVITVGIIAGVLIIGGVLFVDYVRIQMVKKEVKAVFEAAGLPVNKQVKVDASQTALMRDFALRSSRPYGIVAVDDECEVQRQGNAVRVEAIGRDREGTLSILEVHYSTAVFNGRRQYQLRRLVIDGTQRFPQGVE